MSSLDVGLSSSGSALGPQDDRPLTEQEFQLLQRLLADPFSFPIQFKTWLVAYLSASDLTLPISSILGLSTLLGITGAGGGTLGILPAGIILPYGGAVAPPGSLLCDGASYAKTEQARLYSAIGNAYGSVDIDHFNVPDLRGRSPVGLGTHADVNTLGLSDGLALAIRTPKHDSNVRDPGHDHTVNDPGHDHGISDPGHAHGVSDPGHGHGTTVNDPGHAHFGSYVGTAGGGFGGTSSLAYNRSLQNSDAAGTGITVGISGSGTGIGINSAGTGIAVASHSSGVTVASRASGVTVGPGVSGGGRPVDTPAYEVCNFIIIN